MAQAEMWGVVLGATAGTGAAVARELAKDPGLSVFGVHRGRHPEGAAAVVEAVQEQGRRAVLRVGDAAGEPAAIEGVAALREVAVPGSVRIMVHSLASASVGEFTRGEHRFEPRHFERTFETMAHSFVYWTRALIDSGLAAPGCRFLALGNPLDHAPLPGGALIAAAKAALESYVRYLALEVGRDYRVNCLRFGAVETPALQVVMERQAVDTLRPILERSTPAGRLVTLDEVARFVSVLAGDAGAWFNGAVIDMTGGETLGHYAAQIERLKARPARD